MSDPQDTIIVRLADTPSEIEASQRLRYTVFYDEFGAIPNEEMAREKRDIDEYDPIADHLVVLDTSLPAGDAQLIGTYRLLRRDVAEAHGRFYTADEYDIEPLLSSGAVLLELGRSCVLPDYRTRPVLQKLWEGIAHYVADHEIGLMFGCASLHGTDIDALSDQLSYLHHYHLAKPSLRPRAVDSRYVDMNIKAKDDLDAKRVFASLPPLIKGYLRLGAMIGDGAVVDKQFNTTDVCIVMPTHQVTDKYVNHYRRKTQKHIPTDSEFAKKSIAAAAENASTDTVAANNPA